MGIPIVKWSQIQRPKEGSLEVGDLLIKNATMLFKWQWHFSSEKESLWIKIVGSYNDFDINRPVWEQINKSKDGPWTECQLQHLEGEQGCGECNKEWSFG